MERTESTKTYGQADGKGVGMVAKRAKSGAPQSTQRSELKVYRPGSTEGRLPVPCSLRKQRSMTNLAVLTDAEKKLHLYEPKWCDDMAKPGTGPAKTGKPKTAVGSSSAGGGAPLSRNLSKSEHSLFQGKSKPFSPLAAPSALSKQSRIPRGPFAEVKPLTKAAEDGKSDDEILSSKAKAKKQGAAARGDSGSKGQGEEGGDKPFLKVDPELVVTVLGDLEQLLFSQMLGEYGTGSLSVLYSTIPVATVCASTFMICQRLLKPAAHPLRHRRHKAAARCCRPAEIIFIQLPAKGKADNMFPLFAKHVLLFIPSNAVVAS